MDSSGRRPNVKAAAKIPPVPKSKERLAVEGAVKAIEAQRKTEPPPRKGRKKTKINRKAVIAQIRRDTGSSERDIEATLARVYDSVAALGLVVKR